LDQGAAGPDQSRSDHGLDRHHYTDARDGGQRFGSGWQRAAKVLSRCQRRSGTRPASQATLREKDRGVPAVIEYALTFGFVAVSAALVMILWRLVGVPAVMDRVVAVDTMVINIVALLVLYGIRVRTTLYFESALLLAMFSFISTVACCRFLLRGAVI